MQGSSREVLSVSYDLYMFARAGKTMPTEEEFRKFFQGRNHYSLEDNCAFYNNEKTGVGFMFAYEKEKPDLAAMGIIFEGFDELPESDEDDIPYPLIAFNINYSRPRSFIIEAEPEVSALIQHFVFATDDPQTNGMGRDNYSPSGLIDGWTYCNEATRWNSPREEIQLS